MKKVILVLFVAGFLAGTVSAQEWWNSYSPAVENSNMLLNAGIGLGGTGGYGMGIPPISVSVDFFKLPVGLPITLGVIGTLSTWKVSVPSLSYTFTNIGIGARGMYHFNFSRLSDADFFKNSDIYAGLTLGYVIQMSSNSTYSPSPFFLWGGSTGLRYYFTDKIGAYLELGYSGLQYGCIGLAVKF